MRRRLALAAALGPWCAVVTVLALVAGADLSWPAPAAQAPSATPGVVHAGIPFVERDPGAGGATLGCISDRGGTVLPPFLTH